MKKNDIGDKGILEEIRNKNIARDKYRCEATDCPCIAYSDIKYLLNRLDAAEQAAKMATKMRRLGY